MTESRRKTVTIGAVLVSSSCLWSDVSALIEDLRALSSYTVLDFGNPAAILVVISDYGPQTEQTGPSD